MKQFFTHAQLFTLPSSLLSYVLGWVLAFLLLSSCREDEPQPVFSYPSIYHATHCQIRSDVRLFTKQGPIKNQSVVDRFLTSYQEYWTRLAPKSGPVSYGDTISFLAPDNVQHSSHSRIARLEMEGNRIRIIPKDTFAFPLNEMNSYDSHNTYIAVSKYKPLYEKRVNYGYSSGYGMYIWLLTAEYAEYASDQLKFDQLSFMVKQGTSAQYRVYGARYNNSFDPKGYLALANGDALAIQESVVVYEK